MIIFKKIIRILRIAAIIIVPLFIFLLILYFLLQLWFSRYTPSSGTWQYSDDDLTITVYVPKDGGIPMSGEPFSKLEAEFSYKGEKSKAVLAYNGKMYQCYLAVAKNGSDILIESHVFGSTDIVFSSGYRTPMKIGEWELENVELWEQFKDVLKDYDGENIILKRIGKYKIPE